MLKFINERLKEPYWFFGKENIQILKEEGFNAWDMLKLWFRTQLRYFIELRFKKCGISPMTHFWGMNMKCLRCGKNIRKISWEFERLKNELRIARLINGNRR